MGIYFRKSGNMDDELGIGEKTFKKSEGNTHKTKNAEETPSKPNEKTNEEQLGKDSKKQQETKKSTSTSCPPLE